MSKALRWVLVVALAGVLAWAALGKIADPSKFRSSILGFRIVGDSMAWALAYYLPWLELVTAVALLVTRWARGALILSVMLFSSFAVLWGITLARGLDPECGCFGSGGGASPWLSLLRAVGLALLALWTLRTSPSVTRSA